MLMRVCLGPGIKMNMTIQGAHSVAQQSSAAGERVGGEETERGGERERDHRLIATAEFQCFALISGGSSVTEADPSIHHEASFCEY